MKKILVIDNNIDLPHGSLDIVHRLEKQQASFNSFQIKVCRGPDNAPAEYKEDWNAVIISGSKTRILDEAPWIEKQMQFIRDLYDKKTPTFGICYGEQLIVRSLLGKKYIGPAPIPEYGWIKIEKTFIANTDNFLSEVPEVFYSLSFHQDEVRNLPESFHILAKSNDCSVQAYEIKNYPFLGVQFHPEKALEEADESLRKLKQRKPNMYIHHPDKGGVFYNEALGDAIFHSFLQKVYAP